MTLSRPVSVCTAAVVAVALLIPAPASAASADPAPPERTTVHFSDPHQVLHGNPYTGTAFDINSPKPEGERGYTFATDPAITAFIDGSQKIPDDADIVRLQIAWADFEPENDVFRWDRLDAFMDRITEQHKTVEFQLLMSEAPDIENDPNVFAYEYPPRWLFDDAGASYRLASYNDHYTAKQPLYYDPIYLTELREAVEAFGARYDENPGMAWVDLRAFALFGEWSGWNDALSFPWPDSATRLSTLRSIIDIYKDAFTETMVMMPNAGADVVAADPDADTQAKRHHAFAFDYGAENEDWGFRSDTVNSAFAWMNYSTKSQSTWNNRLLRRDHIQVSEGSSWNSSIMANNPRLVVKNALEGYRTNLQGINNTSFADWDEMKSVYGEWFTTLARYSGYRFTMPSATYPTEIAPGEDFTLSQIWTNGGVGFSPRNYPLRVSLLDADGDAVWSGTDDTLTQRRWFKGEQHTVQSTFHAPASLEPGTYRLAMAMVDENGDPRIELAMPDGDGKVYPIGEITVVAGAGAVAPPAVAEQFRVEGEDYTAASGAYGVEAPPEGGFGAVYFDEAGEWAEYSTVDVPVDGRYTLELRVSSEAGNHLAFEIDGEPALPAIVTPDTGGYNTYRTIERQVDLAAGRHSIPLTRTDGRWLFLNWMRFTLATPDDLLIQAEDASSQEGTWLKAEDAITDDGTPGVSVIDAGDWLQYDGIEIAETGDYLLRMRYSTVNADPLAFRVLVDGVEATGDLQLGDTGGIGAVRTEDFVLPLTAGTHSVRIVWTQANSSIVWNWMKLSRQGDFRASIEAEDYTMQWNLAKEWEWNGADTGVVTTERAIDGETHTVIDDIDVEDYLRYENIFVPHSGAYRFAFTAAADGPQTLRLEIDGDPTTVLLPDTDGEFAETGTWVTLPAGVHDVRLVAASTGLRLDRFTITAGTAPVKALIASGPSTLDVGETGATAVEAVGADGSRRPVTDGVRYSSSDPTIATVGENGEVTAVRWGTARITATLDGRSGEYAVSVSDPGVQLTHVNDDDPGMVYSGEWGVESNRPFGDYEDDIHYSTTAGDSVTYSFTGTGIAYLTEKYVDMGPVEIYLDDELAATVEPLASTRSAQQMVFRIDGLEMRAHTLRVVNLTSYSESRRIAIMDAVIVESPVVWPAGSALEVTKTAAKKADLRWSPAAAAASIVGYAIFADGVELARVRAGARMTTVTGLDKGTTYTFTVQAIRADGTLTADGPSAQGRTKGR
ncbi:carbohydrate-binding protein [Microbacterium sp. NPDC058342]|uniref:carbohydrate-binding protein n=1 Tax=Microbacterium sp. NPDC058342 TaxID=3346454 RepID=UPI0036676C9C